MNGKESAEFLKILQGISHRNGQYETFCDWLRCGCFAFAQTSHWSEDREKDVRNTLERYTEDERSQFPVLLAITAKALTGSFCDFLGEVYMCCDFGNQDQGQFFTPYDICLETAKMMLGDDIPDRNRILTFLEPACGGGAMIIAMAQCLNEKGFPYQKNMWVHATDLSMNAVCMTMIQLSLLGIPATIVHGNSLTFETFGIYETPMIGMSLVKERLKHQNKTQ